MRPDARPQAWKNRRRIRWNTLRIFSSRERRRWSRIVRRSRTVNVGQAPKAVRKYRASSGRLSLRREKAALLARGTSVSGEEVT